VEITSKSAFWILEGHYRTGTRLQVGGAVVDEVFAAMAILTEVKPGLGSISLKIFSENNDTTWERAVSFRGARFEYQRDMDHDWSPEFAATGWCAVLWADFADGTRLFFAEQA
jgi:hypothetical protein